MFCPSLGVNFPRPRPSRSGWSRPVNLPESPRAASVRADLRSGHGVPPDPRPDQAVRADHQFAGAAPARPSPHTGITPGSCPSDQRKSSATGSAKAVPDAPQTFLRKRQRRASGLRLCARRRGAGGSSWTPRLVNPRRDRADAASLRLKPREHCQHPPVILARRGQVELPEDVRDVLFYGALGHHQLLGDRAV
jgi:hypothetical protein